MEVSLIARIGCRSGAQRDLVVLMLGDGWDRPLGEDDVAPDQRACFSALEFVDAAEQVSGRGSDAALATWLADDEAELVATVEAIGAAGVVDVVAAMISDEGWSEIWQLQAEGLVRHDTWAGESASDLVDRAGDAIPALLDRLRASSGP